MRPRRTQPCNRKAALAVPGGWPGPCANQARRFGDLPGEVALRVLGRALTMAGDEGPVELGKLEALKSALDCAQTAGNGRFRRTLAGAVVTLTDGQLTVERAPPRSRKLLTKRGHGAARANAGLFAITGQGHRGLRGLQHSSTFLRRRRRVDHLWGINKKITISTQYSTEMASAEYPRAR